MSTLSEIHCADCYETLAALPPDKTPFACFPVLEALREGHKPYCTGKPRCPECKAPVSDHTMDEGAPRRMYCPA